MPRGIGAYNDAGPLSGNVPPLVIDVFVTPVVAAGSPRLSVRANPPGMQTASAASIAASATRALFTSLPPPEVPLCPSLGLPLQRIVPPQRAARSACCESQDRRDAAAT